MERGVQGTFRKQSTASEPFQTFVPTALPPEPGLELRGSLTLLLSRADQMLGRLDGLARILPHPDTLIDFYVRKEAVLSSQIEGTQSTLADLLLFELQPDRSDEDTLEVSNYVDALRHGLERLRSGFPLSLRLIREMHEILLRSGRGSRSTPGEFRNSQNWIGGSRPGNALYVPPPVAEMHEGLHTWEKFLHEGATELPVVVQCALLHLQFETLHPFLDGNGRVGRLLITLLLVERGVLQQPLLYTSLYLKQHRDEYYDLLQRVRMEGIWEEWLEFFAKGVISTAERAVLLADNIFDLFRGDEVKLRGHGARMGSALQVFQQMQKTPYISATRLVTRTGLSLNTVLSALDTLTTVGIVREMPRRRGKVVCYVEYVQLLDEGTVAV